MSCGGKKNVTLVRNQQLRSNADGTKRVYWSDDIGFESPAIFVKLLLLYNSTAMVRVLGRRSVDSVTWQLVGPEGSGGYIDGLGPSGSFSALGPASFQYLGDENDHGPHFQIGIEVDSTESEEGVVTLSAEASFGPIRVQEVDLQATAGTLATATVPTLVPGAQTISTYGCGKVRIELTFGAAPAQAVTLYLATGPSTSGLVVDEQTKFAATNNNSTTMSFVVEAPDAWSTVYYSVAATTTGSVTRLNLVRMP